MRIENDLLICGQYMFVQLDAIATGDPHDPEIEIDNLLVDGERPNEELADQVFEVIEHEYRDQILESMPSKEDIRSSVEDMRYHEWAENPKRRAI